MGGIARRATEINNIRKGGDPMVLVDGGEFAPRFNEQGRIKFETLLESFLLMRYDAISVGEREILMHHEGYDALNAIKSCGIPIITLNVLYRGERLRAHPLIINRGGIRVGLFGLLMKHIAKPVSEGVRVNENLDGIIKEALSFTRNNADFVVAVLDGELSRVRNFVKRYGNMDIVIVSGHGEGPRRLVVNDCLIVSAGEQGGNLGIIEALFDKDDWHFNARNIPLDRYVPKDPALTATYEAYRKRVEMMTKSGAERLKEEVSAGFSAPPFAAACAPCHGDVYDAWDKTAHAHAIDTLIGKNEQHNPECVGCHTTGYLEGGFISMETTPRYVGVQCVSCHGRMDGHIETHSESGERLQTVTKREGVVTENTCTKCHTAERDDDFNFDVDRKRVH